MESKKKCDRSEVTQGTCPVPEKGLEVGTLTTFVTVCRQLVRKAASQSPSFPEKTKNVLK
jgi:hypothetical protein